MTNENSISKFQYSSEGKQRLDHFLVTQMPNQTRSFISKLIKDGRVTVSGQTIQKAGYKLDQPCQISVQIPSPVSTELIPEDIPLDIVFENTDVVLVNKRIRCVVNCQKPTICLNKIWAVP